MYEKKIQTPLHVSPDILCASPPVKNLDDTFMTEWQEMSKVCLHLENDMVLSNLKAPNENILKKKSIFFTALLNFLNKPLF